MIHCDKELYEIVLKENLQNLANMIIIGNSILNYNENLKQSGKPEIALFNVKNIKVLSKIVKNILGN